MPLHSGSPDDDAAFSAVEATLREFGPLALKIAEPNWTFSELPGGASTRRFFRVEFGPTHPSLVAMYVPSPSQEIVKARQVIGPRSFIEVRALLEERGVRVPSLLYDGCHHQVLLVEDLGDDTLAQYLIQNAEEKEELYQSAVSDLARAQQLLEPLPEHTSILERSFDADLLRWEIDHFRVWALEARGIQLSADDTAIFERAADYLSRTIASWPRGFVHRDYQSRNLMVRRRERAELTWIDFQDAMLGPRVYDLVALLTDSYQSFSREFVEARLREYCQARGIPEQFEQITEEFDVVTVQRKLKDAGRFVFIDRVNKNPNFLEFVEPTIGKARLALRRVAARETLGELQALLDRLFG